MWRGGIGEREKMQIGSKWEGVSLYTYIEGRTIEKMATFFYLFLVQGGDHVFINIFE